MVGIFMSIKQKFKAMRNNYVIKQVENIKFPNFENSNIMTTTAFPREQLTKLLHILWLTERYLLY